MMVFIVAFLIIVGIIIVPAVWLTSLSNLMGGRPGGEGMWITLIAVAVTALLFAFVVTGAWSLIAPLFGG